MGENTYREGLGWLGEITRVWATVKVSKALRLSSSVLFSQGNHVASSANKMDNILCSKQTSNCISQPLSYSIFTNSVFCDPVKFSHLHV